MNFTINTVDCVAVRCHHSTCGEVNDAADNSAADQEWSATNTINERQNSAGGDKEDDILDNRRCQCNVAALLVKLASLHSCGRL